LEFLNQNILGNSLQAWLIGCTVFVVTVFLLWLTRLISGKRLTRLAAKTETSWDDILVDVIAATKLVFLLIVGVFVSALFLDIPAEVQSVLDLLLSLMLLIQAGIWVGVIIRALLGQYRHRALAKNPSAVTSINVIGLISKIALWAIVVLLVLDNLGVNVTALVAGLGIGGIAVALALQNILGDLFASLSIMLDKPFVIGDFLIIDDYLGSVEHVGLKTTRVRSLSGEQLVFSNSYLLNSCIHYYGRMFERRVMFTLGVTYDTP
jgi:small-conductance mechanosensitive channel